MKKKRITVEQIVAVLKQAVFRGKSKVSMFEMNKYFAQHLS